MDEVERQLAIANEIEDAISYVLKRLKRNKTDLGWSASRAVVNKMSADAVQRMATSWLAEQSRNRLRESTRAKERAAIVSGGKQGYTHGSTSQRKGAASRGCECDACKQARAEERELESSFNRKMLGIIESYSQQMKIQWTEQLLSETFSLPDGTRVLWGKATVAEHLIAVDMYVKQGGAAIENAARHKAVVAEIQAAGVANLESLKKEAG